MQRNINKEIRNYEEDVFMGLSLRQVLWSCAAIGAAVGVYFALQPLLGRETVSWVCIVAAVPFAAAGFFSYDGMTVWQFLQAVVETEVLYSGVRIWAAGNRFYDRQYGAERNVMRRESQKKPKQTSKIQKNPSRKAVEHYEP